MFNFILFFLKVLFYLWFRNWMIRMPKEGRGKEQGKVIDAFMMGK